MTFKFLQNIRPRPSVSISEETMATLWKLQGILNKASTSDLVEHITADFAKRHGLTNLNRSANLNDNSSAFKLLHRGLPPLRSERSDDDPEENPGSQVNFVLFRNAYLENVPPTEACVDGKWFKIEAWNAVLFEVIRVLLEKEVSEEEIVNVLHPNIKIGHPDGYKPIPGINLSYNEIRSPRKSWELIEKLNDFRNMDVRIRFKWNEKAKLELRGLSYEIRTLPHDADANFRE